MMMMMMMMMMMKGLLPLSVLLLLSITHTVTKVVDSMSQCEEGFLLENKPPQVTGILDKGEIKDQNRYKIICQTYDNTERFVTLYDTKNKIPVFSAFKYRGDGEKAERPRDWKIEPQLEKVEDDKTMKTSNKSVYNYQASNDDYKTTDESKREYDRGHLFPFSYGFDKNDKISTFTLTNVVPQAKSFNQGSWNKMEQDVKSIMNTNCLNRNDKIEGYVVTGAQPGENKLKNGVGVKLPEKGVNIPSMLWSAFCCYSKPLDKWIANAYWRENVQDQSKDEHVKPSTLQELYDKLDKKVEVFPGTKCPLVENPNPTEESKSIFNRLIKHITTAWSWIIGKLTG